MGCGEREYVFAIELMVCETLFLAATDYNDARAKARALIQKRGLPSHLRSVQVVDDPAPPSPDAAPARDPAEERPAQNLSVPTGD